MKNLFLSFAVIVSVLAVSCKKEDNVKPEATTTPAISKTISVAYKVESESGNVEISYMFPNADGKLELVTETVNRNEYEVKFTCKSGSLFSIEAHNVNPARKVVHLQMYIDGTMVQESTSTSSSERAIVSGTY